MSLVVAVEDVWTSLCYPRCPGGHGVRPAGLRRAAQDWRGRLMSRLRSGAGAVWAPADACWLEGRAVGENSPGRCHGAVPEAQPARRLRVVWATAGMGVCMAANGGAAVTSGALMELLSGRGCLPGVTDAGRVAFTSLRVSSRDGRALPRGQRLCDGLVPAASLMRVPGWDQQGGSR